MARRRRSSARYSRFDDYGGYDPSYEWGGWAPYVPVAARKAKAARAVARMKKSGREVSPVTIKGLKIATTFWGKAWCDNLERYSDYANRIPRGRTYVRNGSVVDLQIGAGRVEALVSGSEVYRVALDVKAVPPRRWKEIRARSAGGIASLVELLQGRFSEGVMAHLCEQRTGLFPTPQEIAFSCSCPDSAYMCKHVAAVLYGVGARLDHEPELLFRLRHVDGQDLVTGAAAAPLSAAAPTSGKVLRDDDLGGIFGVELEAAAGAAPARARAKKTPGAGRARAKATAAAAAAPKAKPAARKAKAAAPQPKPVASAPKVRRAAKKRRTMTAEERAAVAERMRRLWAERKRG